MAMAATPRGSGCLTKRSQPESKAMVRDRGGLVRGAVGRQTQTWACDPPVF